MLSHLRQGERSGWPVPLVIMTLCIATCISGTQAEPPAKPDPKAEEEKTKDDQAKRLAEQFVRLIVAKDVAGLLKIADVPHYQIDGAVLNVCSTRKELEMNLDVIRHKEDAKDLSIKITRVTTWAAGHKLLPERVWKRLDKMLQKDDRMVWLEASGSGPGGKPEKETSALIFRPRDGGMKWIGWAR